MARKRAETRMDKNKFSNKNRIETNKKKRDNSQMNGEKKPKWNKLKTRKKTSSAEKTRVFPQLCS